MINPSSAEAVAAEHQADLRREAAHQQISRQGVRRLSFRHDKINRVVLIPAPRAGDAGQVVAREEQELCMADRR